MNLSFLPPYKPGKAVIAKKLSYKEQKELEELELQISRLEDRKKELETRLGSGTLSVEEAGNLSGEYASKGKELDELFLRWMELTEKKGQIN